MYVFKTNPKPRKGNKTNNRNCKSKFIKQLNKLYEFNDRNN